jgi:hypothetical protein
MTSYAPLRMTSYSAQDDKLRSAQDDKLRSAQDDSLRSLRTLRSDDNPRCAQMTKDNRYFRTSLDQGDPLFRDLVFIFKMRHEECFEDLMFAENLGALGSFVVEGLPLSRDLRLLLGAEVSVGRCCGAPAGRGKDAAPRRHAFVAWKW